MHLPLQLVASAILPLLLLAILVPAAAPAAVPHVRNGTEPREGTVTVDLVERWRAGGDSDDTFFGRVPRVDTDAEGNVYILDAQLCQVHVYSPDGEPLRIMFREGEGPGESRDPRDMIVMPDGSVGLVAEGLGEVLFVDAHGDPAGSFRMQDRGDGNYALVSGVASDGNLVLGGRCSTSGESPSIRNRRNFLARCDRRGQAMVTYIEQHTSIDFADPGFEERRDLPPFHWGFDAGRDGRVYAVSDRDAYAIEVFEPDGTPAFVIEREYPPFPRAGKDHARLERMIETSMEGMPFEIPVELADTNPAITFIQRGLQVRDDGSLWVLSGRGLKPEASGIMAEFDIFDAEGVFVRRVSLAAPHDADRVGIVLAGRDRVIVIAGFLESIAFQFGNGATFDADEWATPEVIVYDMVPRE